MSLSDNNPSRVPVLCSPSKRISTSQRIAGDSLLPSASNSHPCKNRIFTTRHLWVSKPSAALTDFCQSSFVVNVPSSGKVTTFGFDSFSRMICGTCDRVSRRFASRSLGCAVDLRGLWRFAGFNLASDCGRFVIATRKEIDFWQHVNCSLLHCVRKLHINLRVSNLSVSKQPARSKNIHPA